MKKLLMVSFIIGFITLVGVFFVARNFFLGAGDGQVIFINNATEEVVSGQIEIADQNLTVERLKPGERKMMLFKATKESHYKVIVYLVSGKIQTANIGYITNGLDFQDTILLTDDGISLGKDSHVSVRAKKRLFAR